MNQPAETDEPLEPIVWPPAFDGLIRGAQAWLAERGETIVGSGCFRSGRLSGSIHTDFGPEDQDKDANQDYAVAWLPRDEELRKRFQLVVALADGLTASFRSEWASAAVCSVAVRALAQGDPDWRRQNWPGRPSMKPAGAWASLPMSWHASRKRPVHPANSCPPGSIF